MAPLLPLLLQAAAPSCPAAQAGRWPQMGPQPQRWRRKGPPRLLLQLVRHPRWLHPKLALCPTLQRQVICPTPRQKGPRSL